MDPSLIFLLAVMVLMNAQSFYFGFYRKVQMAAWLQQASFIITGTLLIPFLIFALYSQAGSGSRLEEFGIPIHPDFDHSIGILNGYGENPTWIFSVKKDAEDILSFYAPSRMNPLWELKESNSLYLRYVTNHKDILIAHSKHYGKQSVVISTSDKG